MRIPAYLFENTTLVLFPFDRDFAIINPEEMNGFLNKRIIVEGIASNRMGMKE